MPMVDSWRQRWLRRQQRRRSATPSSPPFLHRNHTRYVLPRARRLITV